MNLSLLRFTALLALLHTGCQQKPTLSPEQAARARFEQRQKDLKASTIIVRPPNGISMSGEVAKIWKRRARETEGVHIRALLDKARAKGGPASNTAAAVPPRSKSAR